MTKFICIIQRLIFVLVISGTIYSAQHKDNWNYNVNANLTSVNLTPEQIIILKR